MTLSLDSVQSVMLAAARVVGFLVVAPPFSATTIPAKVKVALSLAMAVAVAPRLTSVGVDTTGAFIGALVLQVVAGLAMGFLVHLVFAAVQAAGSMIDLFGGFSMAQAYDPTSQTNGAQFARLYQMLATVLLFASDGYQVVLSGMVRSFDALPLDAVLDTAALGQAVAEGLPQMFLSAVQIAGPLIVVLFLTDVGLGLLTRVAPAMNAFALGFPLKVLITLVFGGFALAGMLALVQGLSDDAVAQMWRVLP